MIDREGKDPDVSDLYPQIRHSRTADEVVQQIEGLILDGVLRDGDRLPGERDLAQRFDVSRPILREALKELEARGLLVSSHGGGTFVADIVGQVFSKPLADLIARHERAVLDYLEYRRELEGLTAELAARRATETDKALLTRIMAGMRRAHDEADDEAELAADIELHNAIGEAAHNIVLMHTMRACYRLLSDGIFYNRRMLRVLPGYRDRMLAQHAAIYDAIIAGAPEAAKAAAHAHIDFIIDAMREATRLGEWSRISQLRLAQRQGQAASPRAQNKGGEQADGQP